MNFFEKIKVQKVLERISSNIQIQNKIENYVFLIQNLQAVNLKNDRSYQRSFNGFYKVRRNATWQQIYYEIFEEEKKRVPSFERIICEIWEKTGRVEPSFSSKMAATIDLDLPVWDKYVLQNLHLKLEGTKELRLKNAILLYDMLLQYYGEFLQTDEADRAIELFDKCLSNYAWFTRTKKIDLILWQARDI